MQKAAIEDSTRKFAGLVAALLLVIQTSVNKNCIGLSKGICERQEAVASYCIITSVPDAQLDTGVSMHLSKSNLATASENQ